MSITLGSEKIPEVISISSPANWEIGNWDLIKLSNLIYIKKNSINRCYHRLKLPFYGPNWRYKMPVFHEVGNLYPI
jgi:hypothetical protein